MTLPDEPESIDAEVGSFVSALKEIFSGERWEDVEPYAERAWRACGLDEASDWTAVKERVRAEWP